MNELYNAMMRNPVNRPAVNPQNRMAQVMQAMRNPMPVIMQAFPDIPSYMQNNANQILQYLQQNCGVTNAQIQQAAMQIPRF